MPDRSLRFVALLFGLCLGESVPADAQWRFADVNFPVGLDTFVVRSSNRWVGYPELGMSLTYVVPGDENAELTIYVYPIRSEDTSAAHGDGTGERDKALSEIKIYAQKYRDLSEFHVDSVGPFLVEVDHRPYHGAYARVLMRFGDTRWTSWLYVFVRNRTYLKFRLSYPERSGPALQPHIVPLIQRALVAIEEPPR